MIRYQTSPGHRFATKGSAQGAGFEAFPAGVAAPPRRFCLGFGPHASEALQTPALWSRQGSGLGRPSAPFANLSARITKWSAVSLAPKNAEGGTGKKPWARKTWQLPPPTTPVTSVSRRKAFLSELVSCRRPPCPAALRPQRWVQGLRAHRAFRSGTSSYDTSGGGASKRRPLPSPTASHPLARPGVGGAVQRDGQCACARMRSSAGRGSRVAPPRPGVSARPISQPPQRGADAACGAVYPECSARGQLTGVWFSRRRQRRRRLRRLLLLLRWWRCPGPEPRLRLPSPPPRAPPSPPAPRGT